VISNSRALRSSSLLMTKNTQKTIAISGGFDPIHIGHIRMIQTAAKMGKLVVILNSDNFLMNKKGFVFMPFEERKEILRAIHGVREVVACVDEDQSVCKTLEALKPNVFANGGDRFAKNIPEVEVCERFGIEMVFNVGGEKVQSSSALVKKQNG